LRHSLAVPLPAVAAGALHASAAEKPRSKRVATRPSLGIGRMGGRGNNSSGDIFVAFSTEAILNALLAALRKYGRIR
jgi:L-aminopeptidase/D-esterase-like protein